MKQKIIAEIKTVEQEASAILADATAEVKRIRAEAIQGAAFAVQEKAANAKANAAEIKIESTEKAVALAVKKGADTDIECAEIRKNALKNRDRAVQFVFERIISTDGDR
jgi:hypothetical protein